MGTKYDNDTLVSGYYNGSDGMKEAERLRAQHVLDVKNAGFLLHPSISKNLGANARIAEFGTGTGAWLLDLVKSLPDTCRLDGFDLSASAFPEPSVVPENVRFEIMDCKKPMPSDYYGKYDAVHCRYINVAQVTREDWADMVRNAVRLLKPGGVLQWHEKDIDQLAIAVNGSASSTTNALSEIGRRISTIMPYVHEGIESLPSIFEQEGLRDVKRIVFSSDRDPSTREAMTRLHVQGPIFALRRKAVSDPRQDPQEIDRLEAQAWEDVQSGGYFRFDMHVVLGTKV